MTRRLYRSRRNRYLFGVCGGLAAYFGIDPVITRAGVVVLMLLPPTVPAVVLAYVVLAAVIPEQPRESDELGARSTLHEPAPRAAAPELATAMDRTTAVAEAAKEALEPDPGTALESDDPELWRELDRMESGSSAADSGGPKAASDEGGEEGPAEDGSLREARPHVDETVRQAESEVEKDD